MVSVNFSKILRNFRSKSREKNVGATGESIAAKYLARRGYRIVERNWRCRAGEIDIVADRDDLCIFVEVKSSAKLAFIRPEQRVRSRKQDKLHTLAHYYLKQHKLEVPCRFDIIAVWWEDGEPQLRHFENAF